MIITGGRIPGAEHEIRGIPLPAFPEEVANVLLVAKASVAMELMVHDTTSVIESCKRRAKALSEEWRAHHNLLVVVRLASANAEVAAALSTAVDFPHAATVPAVLYVGNVLASLADEASLNGRFELAADLSVQALDVTRRYQALTGATLDATIYSLAARVAENAGNVAADRLLSAAELLDAFDRSITQVYEKAISGHDLSGPRAFAVAYQFRRAAFHPADDAARAYLKRLRAEIHELQDSLVPASPGAAKVFLQMLEAEFERSELWLTDGTPKRFQWLTE